jgi:hypothetical protein
VVLPENMGDVTIETVLAAAPGQERDDLIRQWCASVWYTFRDSWKIIVELVTCEL